MSSFLSLADAESSDEEDESFRRKFITPAKRARNSFFQSVEEAIKAQLEEYRIKKKTLDLMRLEENAELIRRFLGDVSYFEQAMNQSNEGINKFIQSRVVETLNFSPYKTNLTFTDEEQKWITDEYYLIYIILARTFMRSLTHFTLKMQSIPEIYSKQMNEFYCNSIFNRLMSELHIDNEVLQQTPTTEDIANNEEILAQGIEKAVNEGFDRERVTELVRSSSYPNLAMIERTKSAEVIEVYDDPPMIQEHVDDIAEVLLPAVENLNFIVEEPAIQIHVEPVANLKGILKTSPGYYYSDVDVHSIEDEVQLRAYSDTYRIHEKKKVKINDNPECFVAITNYAQNAIKVHKSITGNPGKCYYLHQINDFWEGEYFNSGVKVTYDYYRTHLNSTRLMPSYRKYEENLRLIKLCPVRHAKPGDIVTLTVPAHYGPQPPASSLIPMIQQNKYLFEYYKKLVCYGSFWDIKANKKAHYNFCYEPMIISDGILEQAKQEGLLNAALFSFPSPFNRKTVIELLNQINPAEYSVTDIIFVWGWDKIYNTHPYEDALADLITLYSLVETKMKLKFTEFENLGHLRLKKPKYWFTTIPSINDSPFSYNISNFNTLLRKFCSITGLGLIDWDERLMTDGIYVSPQSAEMQVSCLYKAMKVAGVRKLLSRDEAHRESNRPNLIEWKEKKRKAQMSKRSQLKEYII